MRDLRGPNCNHWRGGKRKCGGYIQIWKPNHHFAEKKGYVLEHRLVYEESRNCCLLPKTDVHHKDGNKSNNIWYNLEAMFHREHLRRRMTKDMSNRSCLLCGTKKAFMQSLRSGNRGRLWFRRNDGFICRSCHRKLQRLNFG